VFETGFGGSHNAGWASSTDTATECGVGAARSRYGFRVGAVSLVVENAPSTSVIDLIGVARGILVFVAPHIAFSFLS
jgi:hypothetical protein